MYVQTQTCTQSWHKNSVHLLLSCWLKNKLKKCSFQLNLLYQYRIKFIPFFSCSSKTSQKWIPARGQGWPESIFSTTKLPQTVKLQVLFYRQEGKLLSTSKTSAELVLHWEWISATQALENIFLFSQAFRIPAMVIHIKRNFLKHAPSQLFIGKQEKSPTNLASKS